MVKILGFGLARINDSYVVATLVVLIAGTVASTTFGLREAAQRRGAECVYKPEL